MRELKNYFCTYDQENELIQIGYTAKFVSLFEGLEQTENFTSGILRSQALDYFRDLGWDFQIGSHLTKGYWFACAIKGCGYALPNFIKEYHETESALIDKLIELEKEARNGK